MTAELEVLDPARNRRRRMTTERDIYRPWVHPAPGAVLDELSMGPTEKVFPEFGGPVPFHSTEIEVRAPGASPFARGTLPPPPGEVAIRGVLPVHFVQESVEEDDFFADAVTLVHTAVRGTGSAQQPPRPSYHRLMMVGLFTVSASFTYAVAALFSSF